MDFIGRPLTGQMLVNSHYQCIEECSQVKAAIAYGSRNNMGLLKDCQVKGKPLEFYGRYDGSCAVDPEILRWFLDCKSPNIAYRVVPKWLHAKVIWWVSQGAYVGSANLTDRAWNNNYEAGMFLTDAELEHFGLVEQLTAFFDGLRANSQPLDEEKYRAQLALSKQRNALEASLRKVEEEFDRTDPLVHGTGNPIAPKTAKTEAKRYKDFASEWNETLQFMRDIADRVSLPENRPLWITDDVPKGVQADQFLHAYYYQEVRATNEKDAYGAFFERNRRNPELALRNALAWWRESNFHHDHERRTIFEWAPVIRKNFAKDRILKLTEDEWVQAAIRVHAMGDHAAKMSNTLLGLAEGLGADAKKDAFARWLWKQRTKAGRSPLEVLDHVVWGKGDLTERLWQGCHDPGWKLPHVKTSTLGEIVGWANPTVYPPRNMRTSKGLRALGYDVDVNI